MPDIKTKSLDAAPGQMKVWKARLVESGPEVTLIRVPISSTTEDRDGDEFSLAGLESILAGLKSGKVPLYLDHGFRESGARLYGALDMLGAWIDGEIEGSTLYGTAFLDPDNWLAMELARKIDAGLPVGFSVGFGVIKSRNKDNGGLIFDDVSLWEVSAVGIPSNPDAVNSAAVEAVVKSLRVRAGLDPEGDTMVNTPKKKKDPEEVDPEKDKTTKPCPDEDEDDRKKKQPEEEPDEDEEEKKQSDDDEEEEDEEEKYVEILDEKAVRAIIAEEVEKALKPIADRLAAVDEIKTLIKEETKPKRKTGPRAIVVARDTKPVQTKNTEPAGEPDIIIP